MNISVKSRILTLTILLVALAFSLLQPAFADGGECQTENNPRLESCYEYCETEYGEGTPAYPGCIDGCLDLYCEPWEP